MNIQATHSVIVKNPLLSVQVVSAHPSTLEKVMPRNKKPICLKALEEAEKDI